jgi:hypothetical protein
MPRKSASTGKTAVKKSAGAARAAASPKPAPKAKKVAREQIIPIHELSEWVGGILPQTVIVRKPSGAMYQAGTRIYAFTRPDGIAMKLPKERVGDLVDSRADASFLVMGTKTMREWLMLRYAVPSDYRKDGKLFEEAMKFVASLKK